MTTGPIGYPAMNYGLNNQKIALFGLFKKAYDRKCPLVLPKLTVFDPINNQNTEVECGDIFDTDELEKFAGWYGIKIHSGQFETEVGSWDCFVDACSLLGPETRKGFAAVNGVASNFFNRLVPIVIRTKPFQILSEVVFAELGIQTVVQFRIEKDWIRHSKQVLSGSAEPGEEYLLPPERIIKKVQNTPGIPSDVVFIICDELLLTVPKDEIRRQVQAECGVPLVWMSDILTEAELGAFSTLEQSVMNFEVAIRAPFFVGLSRSSAANLVTFEAFSRTRRTIDTHYIYNLSGDSLGKRMDNSSQIVPSLVVNKLLAREPLIAPSDLDCRWTAVLTANISGYGELSSEGAPIPGVLGGALVCGARDNQKGYLIEGFRLDFAAGPPVDVQYRAKLNDGSWSGWVRNHEYVGTGDQKSPIRGFAVRLVGAMAGRYQCVCVGSFYGYPDLVVMTDGRDCCAEDGAPLEAMQLVFRPAGRDWSSLMKTEWNESDLNTIFSLSLDRLIKSRWSFRQGASMVLSEDFRFEETSRIGGFDHFNERTWSLQDSVLRIFRENGQVMWQSDKLHVEGGCLKITLKSPIFPTWANFCLVETVPYVPAGHQSDQPAHARSGDAADVPTSPQHILERIAHIRRIPG